MSDPASGQGSGIDGPTSGRRRATLAELRARLSEQRPDAGLPVLPALAELFPGRGLRKGAAYTVERSTSLVLAMLAGPSRAGSWCGVVGMPELGLEAAEGYGIELGRTVLVPTPERWWETVAALIDVLDVVVVRPPAGVRDSDARRLAARLRERGSALIVADPAPGQQSTSTRTAPWPGCELRFALASSGWDGLGEGHGYLAARQVTVEASGRGSAGRTRTARLWLPDRNGQVSTVQESAETEPGDVIALAAYRRAG